MSSPAFEDRSGAPDYRRAMLWFAGIINAFSDGSDTFSSKLQKAVEVYTLFTQTGDAAYLKLCEDLIQESLQSQDKRPAMVKAAD